MKSLLAWFTKHRWHKWEAQPGAFMIPRTRIMVWQVKCRVCGRTKASSVVFPWPIPEEKIERLRAKLDADNLRRKQRKGYAIHTFSSSGRAVVENGKIVRIEPVKKQKDGRLLHG